MASSQQHTPCQPVPPPTGAPSPSRSSPPVRPALGRGQCALVVPWVSASGLTSRFFLIPPLCPIAFHPFLEPGGSRFPTPHPWGHLGVAGSRHLPSLSVVFVPTVLRGSPQFRAKLLNMWNRAPSPLSFPPSPQLSRHGRPGPGVSVTGQAGSLPQVIIVIYLSVVGALLLYMAFLMLVDPLIRKPDGEKHRNGNFAQSECHAELTTGN